MKHTKSQARIDWKFLNQRRRTQKSRPTTSLVSLRLNATYGELQSKNLWPWNPLSLMIAKKNPKFNLRIMEALNICRFNSGPGKGMKTWDHMWLLINGSLCLIRWVEQGGGRDSFPSFVPFGTLFQSILACDLVCFTFYEALSLPLSHPLHSVSAFRFVLLPSLSHTNEIWQRDSCRNIWFLFARTWSLISKYIDSLIAQFYLPYSSD